MTNDTRSPTKKFSVINESDVDDESLLENRPEEYRAFRSHSTRSQALFELWKSDGTYTSHAYNHVYDIHFDPSGDLVITLTEHRLTIRGRRLHQLFRDLNRNVVTYVWESLPQEAALAGDTPVVTAISIDDRLPLNLNA